MDNKMAVFNNCEFGSIRVIEQNGKYLFCGSDVAKALGYSNPRKAVRDHTRGGTKCSNIGVFHPKNGTKKRGKGGI